MALYCVVWLFTVCFAVVCWVFMVCCVNSVVHPCFLICGFMFCLLVVSCVGVACSAVVIVFWFARGLFVWIACCYVCGFAWGLFGFGVLSLLVG